MIRSFFKIGLAAFAIILPISSAQADSQMLIPNASAIQWMISSGKVYFRNLDQFDSSWLGCCYSHYITLSTDEGRAMFSAFLTARSADKPLMIYKVTPGAEGAILMMGNW